MWSLSLIFVIAKEIESLCGDVPSVFKWGQLTPAGAIGGLYSVFRNTARRKAAAVPGFPMALVCPTVLGGQEHAEDDAKLSSIWYGKRYYKTMTHFLSHACVKSRLRLSKGHSGLFLPLPCGWFSSLPGLFLFPVHISVGIRPVLPGPGLRLLLVPIRSHSMLQEVALLWVSSTSGPAWMEQGHPACASMSLCMWASPSTLHCALLSHLRGPGEPEWFAEKPLPSCGAALGSCQTQHHISKLVHMCPGPIFFMLAVQSPDTEFGEQSHDQLCFSKDT